MILIYLFRLRIEGILLYRRGYRQIRSYLNLDVLTINSGSYLLRIRSSSRPINTLRSKAIAERLRSAAPS